MTFIRRGGDHYSVDVSVACDVAFWRVQIYLWRELP